MALRSALVPSWAVALLVALATPSLADFKESYRQGKDAIDRSDWGAAARHLQDAIDERPEESGRLAALGFQRYLPHFYLGLAHAALGDCRAAVASFAESERQGKISKAESELDALRDRKAWCQELISRTEAAARRARLVVDRVEEAAGQVVRLHRDPQIALVWDEGSPSYAQRQKQATTLLVDGRSTVEEGFRRLQPEAVEAGHSAVVEALEAFTSLVEDLGARRDELGSLFASGLEGLRDLQSQAESALGSMPKLEPVPRRLLASRQGLEAALRRAGTVGENTPVPEIEDIRAELSRWLTSFRNAIAPPPRELMDAAQAYFRGDFDAVLSQLVDDGPRDPRVRAQACLFRAAAWFGLYWADGARDRDLHAAACREVELCHRLEETALPHPDFFPPRFVAFFEDNRPLEGLEE